MTNKRRMLPRAGQKILKPTHSLFAKVFGVGLIVLLVLMIGRLGDEGVTRQAGDPALLYILIYGVNLGLLGTVATGLVYTLYTPWGFLRHRWIIAKWAGCAVIIAVMCAGLAPTILEITEMGDGGLHPAGFADEYQAVVGRGVLWCGIEIILMVMLSIASVFKPGGRRGSGGEAR